MRGNNMKRIYLVLIICFCASYSFAQEKEDKFFYYDADWNKISTKDNASYFRIITFYEDDLHHPIGLVKDFYLKSGRLQWEGKFSYYDIENEKNNREQGNAIWYYENRQKSRQSNFNDGELHGVTKYWHENGEIEYVLIYKDGKIEGTVERYNDNKNLISRAEYKSGKIDGIYEIYYPNGNIRKIYRYENGKQADKYVIEYDEYGSCKMVAEDQFRNNNNNWQVGESINGNWEYDLDTIKGEYSIISNVDDGYIKWEFTNFGVNEGLDPLAFSFSNYVIEAKLKQVKKGNKGSYGIFFGVKDEDNYMYFNVFEGEDKVLCKVKSKSDGIFRDLSEWEEIKNLKKNEFNTFQIRQSINYDDDNELESWTLKFVVNGYQVMESNFDILHGFNFGFGASGDNTHLTTNYINIRYPCQKEYEGSEKNQSACKGSGTGFAINKQGYIATNFHVIGDKATGEICEEIKIRGINGDHTKTYTARVVGKDPDNDLAILKINEMIYDIPYSIGNDKINVAEKVCSYGYPLKSLLGGQLKYTSGEINGKSGFGGDIRYLQHTSTIQPGNSGGPLFNSKGDVIGINTLVVNKLWEDQAGIDTENMFFSVKSSYLLSMLNTINIEPVTYSKLEGFDQTLQYKAIKNFVFLIEVGLTNIK